ncbi:MULTISPECIES: MFS transporter [unclassified Streptomyces]|uniref:MFS transporter n=1 Tax=unclassified Streptomyces TaxID=2593676 RepID=UPI00081DD0D7|nr:MULTISPECIES: MFS transporter [unclassified Streptomyces]MYZ34301.1 MFS transporter [Streptomyces sp. SID4917]SCF65943.1 Major Facilitator Superfamily protein [Streptomyces sp. MnatMP-M17]
MGTVSGDTSPGTASLRLRPGLSFALLGAVQITLIATITVITVALPAIQRDLRLADTDLVFATSAYSLSFGGLLVLGGRLADLLGHRTVFVAGVAVFGAASLAAAAASTLWVMVAARFAQGVGAALAAPAAMALLSSVFPDTARRSRAMAVWGVLASIGASSGNILSGVILSRVEWRWVFVAPAVVSAVIVLCAPLLPTGPARRRERLDVPGALLITAGLTAFIFGLGESDWTWIGVGVLGLALFALTQARSSRPLVPPALLASARRLAALFAIGVTAAAMASYFFLLALYFQKTLGYSPLRTSAAFLPPVFAVLFTASAGGRAARRFGAGVLTAAGLALGAAGMGLLSTLDADSSYWGVLVVGITLFPVGAGFTFSGATVWAVERTAPGEAGLVGGVVNTAMEVGPPVGLAALVPLALSHSASHGAGEAAADVSGYGFAFGVAAVSLAVAAGLVLLQRATRSAKTLLIAPEEESTAGAAGAASRD